LQRERPSALALATAWHVKRLPVKLPVNHSLSDLPTRGDRRTSKDTNGEMFPKSSAGGLIK
jgi:hypothetical protein